MIENEKDIATRAFTDNIHKILAWLQFLKQFSINMAHHILVASLTLMALSFINVSYHILVTGLTLMALF